MKEIPKLIHQVYEGRDGTSPNQLLCNLAETWKKKNPAFEYQFWNYKKIDKFLDEFYPDFITTYQGFRYDVQRWDAIRYLILYHFGGVYVDLDYECLESIDPLLDKKSCCFGLEPPEHCKPFKKDYVISNAFMAVNPRHPFIKNIIKSIPHSSSTAKDKLIYVLETTGPHKLVDLYKSFPDRENISLIPSELVSPLSKPEVHKVIIGKTTTEIEEKVEKAYAIHYFFGSWC